MKTADVDILMIPGWGGNSDEHWQSRWARRLKTARIVQQPDWKKPDCDLWVSTIQAAVATAERPVVLIGHSCGALAIVHAAPRLPPGRVAGAFLVAPSDLENRAAFDAFMDLEGPGLQFPASFLPLPAERLAFASVVIASATDPYCAQDRARGFASTWGSEFADAGDAGHINTASGHGPWPEGLLRLGTFLRRLG